MALGHAVLQEPFNNDPRAVIKIPSGWFSATAVPSV
jgi:hypothetical protein